MGLKAYNWGKLFVQIRPLVPVLVVFVSRIIQIYRLHYGTSIGNDGSTHRSFFTYHNAQDIFEFYYYGTAVNTMSFLIYCYSTAITKLSDVGDLQPWCHVFTSLPSFNVLICWHKLSIWYRIRWPATVSIILQTLLHIDWGCLEFHYLYQSSRRGYMDFVVFGSK